MAILFKFSVVLMHLLWYHQIGISCIASGTCIKLSKVVCLYLKLLTAWWKKIFKKCFTRKCTLLWETCPTALPEQSSLPASLTSKQPSVSLNYKIGELVTVPDCGNWFLFRAIRTCAIVLSIDHSYLNIVSRKIADTSTTKRHIIAAWYIYIYYYYFIFFFLIKRFCVLIKGWIGVFWDFQWYLVLSISEVILDLCQGES